MFAEIVVFKALNKTLHYLVPCEMSSQVEVGKRIIVPLGRSESLGLIIALQETPPLHPDKMAYRPIRSILDATPVVPADLLELCQWISRYYFYPLGEVIKTALPSGIHDSPATCFRLTAAGREVAESQGAASDFLRLFLQQGTVTLAQLEDGLLPRARTRETILQHESQGHIERYFEWRPSHLKPKLVKNVRLLAAEVEDSISDNENLHALLNRLKQAAGGVVALRTLRNNISNVAYWVRKLEERGIVVVENSEQLRQSNFAQELNVSSPPVLTVEQNAIVDEISPYITDHKFQPFLIHGVTGSGKTEVYIRLIERALSLNLGALTLVPEIALSTQVEALFRQRFGQQLAVWHSGLSSGARFDQWREILCGARKVILGVRSAAFMPIANLGLIIVDEEHDASYKQEDRLRYNARDVALMRAKMLQIPVVLGSATPSVQSFHHAEMNRYKSFSLERRILDRPLPEPRLVDMRRESADGRILSATLQRALAETVKNGEQALLFLNRRGFASFLLCHRCGYVMQCRHCSVSLTYHQKEGVLRCHYCGWQCAVQQQCPACGQMSMNLHGYGTERIEEEIRRRLPEAVVVRIDRDTVKGPADMTDCLNAIRSCRGNVLIGTQMIAKGHDFPNITLVGIVNADTALQIGDYRSGETTVQTLMQVAGRTGRGEKPGRVILQTYNPAHYTIEAVMQMRYGNFCRQELQSRNALQYPPFTKLVKFMVTSQDERRTQAAVNVLAMMSRKAAQEFRLRDKPVAILGPAQAPLYRLKRCFRWQLFAKAWTNQDLQEFIGVVLAAGRTDKALRQVQLSVDRDPVTML